MKIDREERRIIDKCYNRARAMRTEHKETLDRIARALQEREALQSDELDTLTAGQPLLPDIPALAPSTPSLVSQDVTSPLNRHLQCLRPATSWAEWDRPGLDFDRIGGIGPGLPAVLR